MSNNIQPVRTTQNILPKQKGFNRLRLVENDSRFDIFAQKIQDQSLIQRIVSWYYSDIKIVIHNTSYHVRVKSVTKRVGITPDVVHAIAKKDNAAELLKLFTNLKNSFTSVKARTRNNLKMGGTRYFRYDDQFYKSEKIGSGAYGKVYKIQNIIDGPELAVKKTRSKNSAGEKSDVALNDLKNEYSILAKIHKCGTKTGIQKAPQKNGFNGTFYVTDLYAGDLTKANEDLLKLPMKERLLLCRQLLQGLKTLHELNFVHGDIKPANCLMKKNNEGKISELAISDLGGAKKILEDGELSDNRVITTPAYLPADLSDGDTISQMIQNADVYAMSKTILETLSGIYIGQSSRNNKIRKSDLKFAIEVLKKQNISSDVIKALTSGLSEVKSRPNAQQLLKAYDRALKKAGIDIPG